MSILRTFPARACLLAGLLACLGPAGCARGDKEALTDPARVEFAYGASVRQAKASQVIAPTSDILAPVEGLHGERAAQAMQSYKYGEKQDGGGESGGPVLFMPSKNDSKK